MSLYKDKWCRVTFGNSKTGPGIYLQKHNMEAIIETPYLTCTYEKNNRYHNDSYCMNIDKTNPIINEYTGFSAIWVNTFNDMNCYYHQDLLMQSGSHYEMYILTSLRDFPIAFKNGAIYFFNTSNGTYVTRHAYSYTFNLNTWYSIDIIFKNYIFYVYINNIYMHVKKVIKNYLIQIIIKLMEYNRFQACIVLVMQEDIF